MATHIPIRAMLALLIAFLPLLLHAGDDPASASLPEDRFMKDGEMDVDAVVEYVEDLYRSDSSVARTRLTVVKPRKTRALEMTNWTRGRDRALIVIQGPAREKGTATLKVERNLWNYFPRIKRTIRIPPSMMLGSWMGSDFTNDDLVQSSSYSNDYDYRLVGRVTEPTGWLIEFTAKPEHVGLWERFELIVHETEFVPVQAKYYDRKGRHARTMQWSRIREFDGRRMPARMVLTPEDKPGHRTEMEYLDIQFDMGLPESTFSLSRLERQR